MEGHHVFKYSIEKLAKDLTKFKNNKLSKNQLNKELFLNISYLGYKISKQKHRTPAEFYFPYMNLSYSFLNKFNRAKKVDPDEGQKEDNSFEQSPIIDIIPQNPNVEIPEKESSLDFNEIDKEADLAELEEKQKSPETQSKTSFYNEHCISMCTMEDIESDAKNELLFKKIETSNIGYGIPKYFDSSSTNYFNSSGSSSNSIENFFCNSAELNTSPKEKRKDSSSDLGLKTANSNNDIIKNNSGSAKKHHHQKAKDEYSKTIVISSKIRSHYHEIYFNDISKETNQSVELWYENFGRILSKKSIQFFHKKMNDIYINLMYFHYMKFDCASKKMLFCQDKMFMNLVKIFILNIGICDKKLYEDILRNLVYKNSSMDFEKFMNCFNKIIKYEDDHSLLKYKFLLCINIKDDSQKWLSAKELQNFFRMINCDKKNEDINEEITTNMINFYTVIYKKENPRRFAIDKLILILEYFFDNK